MWNKAKHVIVYERTTVPSLQFEYEQELDTQRSRGWPILRKTEEYVEPIEVSRRYDTGQEKEKSSIGFVDAKPLRSPQPAERASATATI